MFQLEHRTSFAHEFFFCTEFRDCNRNLRRIILLTLWTSANRLPAVDC